MTTDGIQVVETADIEEAIRERGDRPLPPALPVLPLKEMVAYPDTLTPLAVGQERSVKLIDDVLSGERTLVLVASRDPEIEEPGPDQLYDVGVAGVVARMLKVPDGTIRILVQATERVRLGEFIAERPYLVARIEQLPDEVEPSPELEALTRNVQRTFSEIIEQIPYLPEELQLAVTNIDDPSALSHLIAGALRITVEEKQELLEETDVTRRLRRLSEILARELEVIQLGSRIQSEVQSEMEKGQREYYLREQLKAIQRELGEEDETQAEVNELRERIAEANLPEHAQKAADRELSRLERLPPAAAEYGVIRTYLEWLVELPWSMTTTDDLDIGHAREVLDADHYDLEKVKERILEYLAVRSLNPESHGPILCFVGPPGVGKTSLGKSIARALGREFERISVGGVRDEAEIRGHRRTYIGAMPGTIIRALRDAGSRNPVFMIDEIDKMGADFRGDPSSAMLEVLDPAQNDSFRDHYLDLTFDLSEVIFIATANTLDTIPPPLLDRMEVIQLAGYTSDEKLHIAKRYLVPRQLAENGLKRSQVGFGDAALRAIADEYTREAGVRNLEREIGSVCRKIAREVAEENKAPQQRRGSATPRAAKASTPSRRSGSGAAGPAAVLRRDEAADQGSRRGHRPRVDAGRRRGAVHRGDRDARLGKADDHRPARRRDEGVRAGGAVVGARARAPAQPEAARRLVRRARLHVHVPAGAVPKDGPSAGVAMATALSSLVAGRPVSSDVAMTGEVTLTGQVLPVGGLKEKSLAAQRPGSSASSSRTETRARSSRSPSTSARARVHLRRSDREGARGGDPERLTSLG